MSTVAFFPSLSDLQGNPYWRLLAEALAAHDVHVLSDNPRILTLLWLWSQRRSVQVLHIHYFQDNYAYEGTQARLRWVLRFARNLIIARLLGYRVVWTLHNETPSFPLQPKWVEDFAHLIVARLSSAVIVHCEQARAIVMQRYRRRSGIYSVPHPNYSGYYPPGPGRSTARTRIGLPADATVFLCFGEIRPNKGIEALLEAFGTVEDAQIRLLIIGRAGPDREYVSRLADLSKLDDRIRFLPGWVPDDMVGVYYDASDIVVVPFARVLSSSSVLLALTFAKPVIAPALGCLPEAVPHDAGWLYDPETPGALNAALRAACDSDRSILKLRPQDQCKVLPQADCAGATMHSYGLPS